MVTLQASAFEIDNLRHALRTDTRVHAGHIAAQTMGHQIDRLVR